MNQKSKLVKIVEQFYILVKASLVFWWAVLRGGVVYGWTKAYAELSLYLRLPDFGAKYLRQQYPQQIAKDKLLSFLMSIDFALFFLFTQQAKLWHSFIWYQIIIVILLLISVIAAIYLTLLVWFHQQYQLTPQQDYLLALTFLVKKPLTSLTLLMCVTALGFLAWLNLWLFLFLGPAVYSWLTNKILQRQFGPENKLLEQLTVMAYH